MALLSLLYQLQILSHKKTNINQLIKALYKSLSSINGQLSAKLLLTFYAFNRTACP